MTNIYTIKNLQHFYESDSNKYLFYHISLILWITNLFITLTVVSLNSYNSNRAVFYVPLICFLILTYFFTHCLCVCSFNAFNVIEKNKNIVYHQTSLQQKTINVDDMENI